MWPPALLGLRATGMPLLLDGAVESASGETFSLVLGVEYLASRDSRIARTVVWGRGSGKRLFAGVLCENGYYVVMVGVVRRLMSVT